MAFISKSFHRKVEMIQKIFCNVCNKEKRHVVIMLKKGKKEIWKYLRLFKYSEHVSKPKKSEIEPKKIFKYGLDESTIIFFDLCYLSERLNNIRRKSSCAILSLSQIYNRKLYTYWLRDLLKINVKNHMVNWKYENVIHKFYGRCIRCIRRHVQVKMTVYCISHVCPQSSLTGVIFLFDVEI